MFSNTLLLATHSLRTKQMNIYLSFTISFIFFSSFFSVTATASNRVKKEIIVFTFSLSHSLFSSFLSRLKFLCVAGKDLNWKIKLLSGRIKRAHHTFECHIVSKVHMLTCIQIKSHGKFFNIVDECSYNYNTHNLMKHFQNVKSLSFDGNFLVLFLSATRFA